MILFWMKVNQKVDTYTYSSEKQFFLKDQECIEVLVAS